MDVSSGPITFVTLTQAPYPKSSLTQSLSKARNEVMCSVFATNESIKIAEIKLAPKVAGITIVSSGSIKTAHKTGRTCPKITPTKSSKLTARKCSLASIDPRPTAVTSAIGNIQAIQGKAPCSSRVAVSICGQQKSRRQSKEPRRQRHQGKG